MFICITPKIIETEYEKKQENLIKTLSLRPGDIDELLQSIDQSIEMESKKNVALSFDSFFNPSDMSIDGEYDGS